MKRTPPLPRIRRLRNARPTIQRRVAIRALALFAAFIAFGPTPVVAEGRVYSQPEDVEPLSPGNKIPTAVVQTVLGKPIDLAAAIGDSGALLVFYRGGW
jgi:hypothetical protein